MTAEEFKEKCKSIVRPKPAEIEVASLGKVHLRQFTGKELDYLVSKRSVNGQLSRVELVTRSLCDESGVPILDGDAQENLELVGSLPTLDVQLMFAKVRAINGLEGGENPTKAN